MDSVFRTLLIDDYYMSTIKRCLWKFSAVKVDDKINLECREIRIAINKMLGINPESHYWRQYVKSDASALTDLVDHDQLKIIKDRYQSFINVYMKVLESALGSANTEYRNYRLKDCYDYLNHDMAITIR